MTKKILSTIAFAVGILAVTSTAEANNMRTGTIVADNTFEVIQIKNKHRGNKHRRHNRHWGHGHFEFRPHGCGYFYRKARRTGSRYWWRKYDRCVDRYEHHYRY